MTESQMVRAGAHMVEQLGHSTPVLDHGFVQLVDFMGDDQAVVQAARVSYGKGTQTVLQDKGLIRYLMRHDHWTPFEQCFVKFRVKLPLFVARQWVRHRTAHLNEYSGRYSIMLDEFYVPEIDKLQPQSKTNKQGREGWLHELVLSEIQSVIRESSIRTFEEYTQLRTGSPWFNEDGSLRESMDYDAKYDDPDAEHGTARELARMVLPQNIYTQWYWTCDLRNLFNYLKLRTDSHAQYEIRAFADAIDKYVQQWMPLSHGAYVDYVRDAIRLTGPEIRALQGALQVQMSEIGDTELTLREKQELKAKLKLLAA